MVTNSDGCSAACILLVSSQKPVSSTFLSFAVFFVEVVGLRDVELADKLSSIA